MNVDRVGECQVASFARAMVRHVDGPAGMATEGLDQLTGLQRPDPDGGVPGARNDLSRLAKCEDNGRVNRVALLEQRHYAVSGRTVLPSNCRHRTGPWWPCRTIRHVSVLMSHTRIVESSDPDTI